MSQESSPLHDTKDPCCLLSFVEFCLIGKVENVLFSILASVQSATENGETRQLVSNVVSLVSFR